MSGCRPSQLAHSSITMLTLCAWRPDRRLRLQSEYLSKSGTRAFGINLATKLFERPPLTPATLALNVEAPRRNGLPFCKERNSMSDILFFVTLAYVLVIVSGMVAAMIGL